MRATTTTLTEKECTASARRISATTSPMNTDAPSKPGP
jgi:hypothetical protein